MNDIDDIKPSGGIEFPEEIVLTAKLKRGFAIEIMNHDDEPRWIATLRDYDDSAGARGEFASKKEAFDNIDGFLALAMDAYEKKYAKYGKMPVIAFRDGVLVMELRDDSILSDASMFS